MPKKISPATLKEIRHLRAGAGPNVVRLREVVFKEEKGSLFIVCAFEYAEHDLLGVTARRVRFGPQSVKYIFREIVRGVAQLHARGIFHRDLKTANILLNAEKEVLVADLGLAEEFRCDGWGHSATLKRVLTHCLPGIERRARLEAGEEPLQPAAAAFEWEESAETRSFHCEVTTLLYRAPEQLLRAPGGYSRAADVWSLGCILLELLLGRPFFLAARNKEHLLALMLRLFGRTSFGEAAEGLRGCEPASSAGAWKYRDFGEYLAAMGMDGVTVDLLQKLLQVDPARRIGCEEILAHPFLAAAPSKAELAE